MISIPSGGSRIHLYGPAMVNMQSLPVDREEYPQLPELKRYMASILELAGGIGLAAPQVGVMKQVILIKLDSGQLIDMVNPEITRMVGKEIIGFESCLSVPPAGNGCRVARQETVTVEYGTVEHCGVYQEITLKGRDAVVAQHEIDHLTGTFYFDRVSRVEKAKVLDSFYKWKSEEKFKHVKVNSRSQSAYCF